MHRVCQPRPALKLDHVRTSLHQPGSAVISRKRIGVGAERQIGHQQSSLVAASHTLRVIDHLIEPDRQSGVASLDDVAKGVAHQKHVDTATIHERRKARVVGGQHSDFFTRITHLDQAGQGHRPSAFVILFVLQISRHGCSLISTCLKHFHIRLSTLVGATARF